MRLCNGMFERKDARGTSVDIGKAGKLQHGCDVGLVFGPYLRMLSVSER